VVLLAVGLLVESTDVALLSLMPLAAYALNAALEPPRFAVSRRRVGGAVEIVVESDWRPGVFHIYESTPVESSAAPPRWRLFKPPFRRRLTPSSPSGASPRIWRSPEPSRSRPRWDPAPRSSRR